MKSYVNLEKLVFKIGKQSNSFHDLIDFVKNSQISTDNIFIAGGVVRDYFLKNTQKIKDIDIFLSNEAFEIIKLYLTNNGKLFKNQFNSYRWQPCNDIVYYDLIIINEFYNGLWKCRNIIDVLNQFDFTINAVAFDLLNGDLYDCQNGLLDIDNKILRAIRFDYPEISLSEKIPLSRNTILYFRYLYYAKKLKLNIDPLTLEWIEANVSRKREEELFKSIFFDPQL